MPHANAATMLALEVGSAAEGYLTAVDAAREVVQRDRDCITGSVSRSRGCVMATFVTLGWSAEPMTEPELNRLSGQ